MNEATIDTDRSPLWLELVVRIAETLASTVTKYVAVSTWMFRAEPAQPSTTAPAAPTVSAVVS